MSALDQLFAASIIVACFGSVILCAVIGTAVDRNRRSEQVTYRPARAAARALRTPVVLPPGHPSRPDRLGEFTEWLNEQ